MREPRNRLLFIAFFALLNVAVPNKQPAVARSTAAYHPNQAIHPAALMSPQNFQYAARRGYIVVEGYIDYIAGSISQSGNSTRIKTEADGDFHFEMQSTNSLRPPGESPNGLVCEIDPTWQLNNSGVLSQISRKRTSTYRKVRVYGWLRFGTESGHSGTKAYKIGNGSTFKGHWEIHPVEKVEAIDGQGAFQIGPSARIVSWPITKRYKLTNANFARPGPSNYAKLTGKVQRLQKSADKSGDVDIRLKVGSRTYLATIPQYYISRFDANTQTLVLLRLPNFVGINYSLKPSNTNRSLYGLRNWRFSQAGAFAALQPVEMIK